MRTFSSSWLLTSASLSFISARSWSTSAWYFARISRLPAHAPIGVAIAATSADTMIVIISPLIHFSIALCRPLSAMPLRRSSGKPWPHIRCVRELSPRGTVSAACAQVPPLPTFGPMSGCPLGSCRRRRSLQCSTPRYCARCGPCSEPPVALRGGRGEPCRRGKLPSGSLSRRIYGRGASGLYPPRCSPCPQAWPHSAKLFRLSFSLFPGFRHRPGRSRLPRGSWSR